MSNFENKPKNNSTPNEPQNQLSEESIVRILNELREEKEQNDVVEHKPFTERVLEKKGVFNFLYKKLPLRYVGVSSFSQTHQTIVDSYESFKSPICPKCCSAILMYNKRVSYRDGTVDWFCADQSCDFTLRCSPKGSLIKERIRELNLSLNANRWDLLSEQDKEELISSHLSKAIIYRNIAFLFLLIFLAELLLTMWMVSFITVMLFIAIFVRSLYWGFRAYQIKTGKVFDKRIPFNEWLSTANKWFSVEWIDEQVISGDEDEDE